MLFVFTSPARLESNAVTLTVSHSACTLIHDWPLRCADGDWPADAHRLLDCVNHRKSWRRFDENANTDSGRCNRYFERRHVNLYLSQWNEINCTAQTYQTLIAWNECSFIIFLWYVCIGLYVVLVFLLSHVYFVFPVLSVLPVWLSGNALVLINVVALRRARLVLGWVTVRYNTILVFNQSHPGLLSLAIPPWVDTMSTGGGLGHR